MRELVYKQIMADLKDKIIQGKFTDLKLPDERTLAAEYNVSRSSIKRALTMMANEGIIFKKRGSGTFINPLYLKNDSFCSYDECSNLGVSDNFQKNGEKAAIKVLDFEVISPTPELQETLFLKADDFVYKIRRLRSLGDQPFMIETGYIPIKIVPQLSRGHIESSLFNYMEQEHNHAVTRSFLSICAEPSTINDQDLLNLQPVEPVGVMEGVFFLDNGTPFEFSHMRLHYKYLKFNSFVALDKDK